MCHLWVSIYSYYVYSGTTGTVARPIHVPLMGELWVYYVYSGTKGTSARPVRVPPMGELWV